MGAYYRLSGSKTRLNRQREQDFKMSIICSEPLSNSYEIYVDEYATDSLSREDRYDNYEENFNVELSYEIDLGEYATYSVSPEDSYDNVEFSYEVDDEEYTTYSVSTEDVYDNYAENFSDEFSYEIGEEKYEYLKYPKEITYRLDNTYNNCDDSSELEFWEEKQDRQLLVYEDRKKNKSKSDLSSPEKRV